MQSIVIIDYGGGNTRSVQFALERMGLKPILSNDKTIIQEADKVIFPGVGQAQSAMNNLQKEGLDVLIPTLQQPVLGICLGMQLLNTFSEEGETDCLGILPENVQQFPKDLRVPHIGWNQIKQLNSPLFEDISDADYFYFVHSYYVPTSNATIGKTDYGISFAAAIQKDNFYGVQFHPEKSGEGGEQLLSNFINNIQ